VGEGVSGARLLARHERLDRLLRKVVGPPDRLDRDTVVVAEDATDLGSLATPCVEPDEPHVPCKLEAFREVEAVCGHQQHLDVRKVISNAARDAAGQHDFLDNVRKRPGDPLCDGA
jgi:hypothetical protein